MDRLERRSAGKAEIVLPLLRGEAVGDLCWKVEVSRLVIEEWHQALLSAAAIRRSVT